MDKNVTDRNVVTNSEHKAGDNRSSAGVLQSSKRSNKVK